MTNLENLGQVWRGGCLDSTVLGRKLNFSRMGQVNHFRKLMKEGSILEIKVE
jgi:hypothetical protein